MKKYLLCELHLWDLELESPARVCCRVAKEPLEGKEELWLKNMPRLKITCVSFLKAKVKLRYVLKRSKGYYMLGDSCHLPPDGGLTAPRAVPSSAYEHRRWWDHETEANHFNQRAWANAGWKLESLDVNTKWVKFVRAATAGRPV